MKKQVSQFMGGRKSQPGLQGRLFENHAVKPNAGQIRAKESILFKLMDGSKIKFQPQIKFRKSQNIYGNFLCRFILPTNLSRTDLDFLF